MGRKTWITVKRGLLEAKHKHTMGVRLWLYLYMLDICDWDTGTIITWRDQDAADHFQDPIRTIRENRIGLEADGYISCYQGFQCLKITIHNWTNPREYSGKVYNTEGGKNLSPWSGEENSDGDTHGDTHGDIDGDTHGYRKLDTPTYSPNTKDQIPPVNATAAAMDLDFGQLCAAYETNIGALTGAISDILADDLKEYGLTLCLDAITESLQQNVRKWSYIRAILKRWKNEGRGTKTKKASFVPSEVY